ncbi:hypothetical protein [Cereibacter sphaeroides]|uniref:hypothetical protein n=1 Tax=Cereibacter sphaeroides TaxID=1063 RepID=UPI000191C118|nr:hypothetical protein [Cereibacter sphaeroides]ACM02174.1 Hypothetical Protein RSKD131_2314 [Cereibacter sphaeroides KD131]
MAHLTRRNILAGASLALTGAAIAPLPAAGHVEEDGPFRRLWREYRAVMEAFDASNHPDGHPDDLALMDRMHEIEHEIASLEPRSLDDLAILVLFADDGGLIEGLGSACTAGLMARCRALTGEA